jgi:hypothetical protein
MQLLPSPSKHVSTRESAFLEIVFDKFIYEYTQMYLLITALTKFQELGFVRRQKLLLSTHKSPSFHGHTMQVL